MAILKKRQTRRGAESDKSCGGTPQIGILLDDVNDTSNNLTLVDLRDDPKTTIITIGNNLTESGNADRLIANIRNQFRYCPTHRCWYEWTGTHWKPDKVSRILLRAKEIADSIYAEAIADEKQRAEVLRHASRSGTAKSIQAMVQLASCDPSVIVLPEDMDRHPMRLNCENGTLDLTTGRLHDHNRNEMITHCLPVKFDNEATCAHWLAFLDRIFAGNDAVIDFVQRAIGYSLTADTREQCLFFLHGDGQNGKSTFINLLLELLDTYALRTPTETLMTRRNEGVPNDIAALDGPRFVTASEVSEHQRLNEPRIKDLTGGDRISARFMRGEFFNFTPVFKLWLSGNHKPRITGTDSGIWRRIRLIPFEVTIPDADIDRDLPKKLRAELPGILRWAVEGCLNVQNDGLRVPESVTSATENYRKEMDTIGDFIAECCVTGPDFRIKASVLYQAYSEWCKESGYQALNLTNFGLNISKRGYEKKKITAGVHYLEISLKA